MGRKTDAQGIAVQIWDRLDDYQRWELGDAFVLGTFDWRDWFEKPVPGAVLNELDRLRMLWEV